MRDRLQLHASVFFYSSFSCVFWGVHQDRQARGRWVNVAGRAFINFCKDLVKLVFPEAKVRRAEATAPAWPELRDGSEKPTVVLISGFVAPYRNLSVMRKRLRRDGFNVVICTLDWETLSDSVRGLYQMAEKLSSVVLKVQKHTGMRRRKVYLVAHSAGGLVARYYVQLLGGSHYCDGLITMATPHRGIWMAALGLLTPLVLRAGCLLQMLPSSGFIRALNATDLPAGFPLVSIYSKDDLVCPPNATRLPDAIASRDTSTSIAMSRLSHRDFLLSKKTYRLVLKHLGPTPSEPVKAPVPENNTQVS